MSQTFAWAGGVVETRYANAFEFGLGMTLPGGPVLPDGTVGGNYSPLFAQRHPSPSREFSLGRFDDLRVR
ncbi:hypothetical protein, partial [Rhodopirellula bahusiensis]|uniref:hypothetical protein n=1 Tax=Rhodopirellula bahusiensis TaxID=2014065 RepID=UPI00329A676B